MQNVAMNVLPANWSLQYTVYSAPTSHKCCGWIQLLFACEWIGFMSPLGLWMTHIPIHTPLQQKMMCDCIAQERLAQKDSKQSRPYRVGHVSGCEISGLWIRHLDICTSSACTHILVLPGTALNYFLITGVIVCVLVHQRAPFPAAHRRASLRISSTEIPYP